MCVTHSVTGYRLKPVALYYCTFGISVTLINFSLSLLSRDTLRGREEGRGGGGWVGGWGGKLQGAHFIPLPRSVSFTWKFVPYFCRMSSSTLSLSAFFFSIVRRKWSGGGRVGDRVGDRVGGRVGGREARKEATEGVSDRLPSAVLSASIFSF